MTDKVIVLDGIDYLICNDIVVDNVNYLYALSLDGSKHTLLIRKVENGEDTVESVTDENEIKRVFDILAKGENN